MGGRKWVRRSLSQLRKAMAEQKIPSQSHDDRTAVEEAGLLAEGQSETGHHPTGNSKWNPIEHRLFSYISLNWACKPLRSLGVMLGYIGDTTTETGFKVKAFLVDREYKKGIKVSDKEMATLNLEQRSICPN